MASVPVKALAGGTRAWRGAGLPLEHGAVHLADETNDVWYKPYDHGTGVEGAMRALPHLGGRPGRRRSSATATRASGSHLADGERDDAFDPDAAQRDEFERDGYVIVRGLFDGEEIALLREAIERDPAIRGHFYDRFDAAGKSTRMALWNQPGDDIYGAFVRCRRIVDTMERLLGGEVYHYHHKMILKEPHVGGAWEWHQDYGYWYNNGCLFPDLASCLIAVDRATRENGCLQVLKGSHRMGRIDHVPCGDQTGADPERVEAASSGSSVVYCELEPGSAIFFHCNLLHRSDRNRAPTRAGR